MLLQLLMLLTQLGVGGLVAISGVLYISDIMQFFDHDKSSSILVNQRQIEKSPKVNQII